jgi:transposase
MRHCEFVNRLIYKSIEYENVEIHHCKEHYTSKTCTNCGSQKTLRDTTVRCKDCGFKIHRDLSGARNMIIKHLKLK